MAGREGSIVSEADAGIQACGGCSDYNLRHRTHPPNQDSAVCCVGSWCSRHRGDPSLGGCAGGVRDIPSRSAVTSIGNLHQTTPRTGSYVDNAHGHEISLSLVRKKTRRGSERPRQGKVTCVACRDVATARQRGGRRGGQSALGEQHESRRIALRWARPHPPLWKHEKKDETQKENTG